MKNNSLKKLLSADSWGKHFSETVKRLGKNNAGFSLVELIVVIAIMAILAAVAVVGFSLYIPKAQQAADEQLISDIEYAMTLAGYSGDFVVGDSGYIILIPEGDPMVAEGDKIVAVMEASFGSNWKKEVALKYDGWTVNTALLESATAGGQTITDSIYVQNSSATELLENVQTVTQAASGMLGSVVKNEEQYLTALELALGPNYLEMAAEAGLMEYNDASDSYSMPAGSIGADGNVQVSTDMQNQLSNLMVLSVADELDGLSAQDMVDIMNDNYTGTASMAAQMAVKYSVVKAVDLKNGGNTQAFKDLNTSLENANGISDIETAINNYSAAGGEQFNAYLYDESGNISTEAKENFSAVGAIMGGVTSVAGDYKNADSLKDANLFTSGGVSNYLNLYVSAATLQLPVDIPENGIVLIYQMGDDGVMNVYPLYS